jgi:hypothetical protein
MIHQHAHSRRSPNLTPPTFSIVDRAEQAANHESVTVAICCAGVGHSNDLKETLLWTIALIIYHTP